jgi:hypothetical protein
MDETIKRVELARPMITKFENEIWFGKNLMEFIRESEYRGFSGQAGNLTILMYRILARVMITIQDQGTGHWVTLAVCEEPPIESSPMLKKNSMGLHMSSIDGAKICEFVSHAIDNWTSVKNDDKVKLDVLAAMQ